MIDLRYHIYSLAAVFFALAVGIVIGTSFAMRTPRTVTERKTIARYSGAMATLKQEIEKTSENAQMNARLFKGDEEFCNAILPIIVKDKLLNRNVAIVRTGDYGDFTQTIKHSLELAGATVVNVTDINGGYNLSDDNLITQSLIKCRVPPPMEADAALDKLFSILAGTVSDGMHGQFVDRLTRTGFATLTGDFDKQVKLVVVVGGAKSAKTNRAQKLDSRLIAHLINSGVTVVGCEGSDAGVSYVNTWHKSGAASVDNIDSAIGQINMIFALGGENSKFGVKDSADRLIPTALEAGN